MFLPKSLTKIYRGILMLAAAASLCRAQPGCIDLGAFSPIGIGTGTGEGAQPVCTLGTIPQGRRFVAIRYVVTLADGDLAERPANGTFGWTLSVTAGSQTLFSENLTIAANPRDTSLFPGAGTTRPGFPNTLFYTRSVERVIDVSGLTQTGPVNYRVNAAAQDLTPEGLLHADGLSADGFFHSDIRFTVNETPRSFVPVASTDSAAHCSPIDRNCFPEYTARVVYQQAQFIENRARIKGRIRFRLTTISDLPGISSNEGTGASADYTINPALQVPNQYEPPVINPTAVTMRTLSNQLESSTLIVSSLDYGGRARLIAEFLPGSGSGVFKAEVEGAARADREYASLPVDEDGNWIADEWEKPFAQAAMVGDFFPNPQYDEETGGAGVNTPAGKRGDRFPAFDEYRGFHYMQGAALAHVRTDPALKQDVFFLDSTQDLRFETALNAILRLRTPFIEWRRVDNDRANLVVMADPSGGALELNRNSRFQAASLPGPLRGHALVFYQKPAATQPPISCGGQLATAQGLSIFNPKVNRAPAILFDADEIKVCAGRNNNALPLATLEAVIVAHEAGHRLGLVHYSRRASYVNDIPASRPYAQLRKSEFALDPSGPTKLYNRLNLYFIDGGAAYVLGDRLDLLNFALAGNSVVARVGHPGSPPASARSWIFEQQMASPVPSTLIRIEEQQDLIMDWSPRHNPALASPSQWVFSPARPDDLADICVACRRSYP